MAVHGCMAVAAAWLLAARTASCLYTVGSLPPPMQWLNSISESIASLTAPARREYTPDALRAACTNELFLVALAGKVYDV